MKPLMLLWTARLAFLLTGQPGGAMPPAEALAKDLSSAAGVSWEFKPEGGEWKSIAVPAGGWRAQGYTCDAGTYRTRISIPRSAQGQIVRLAFAAVNFGAEVFVGTEEAHLTKVASHINGWMPFTADLTPTITPGQTVLVQVAVRGRRKFMVNSHYTVPEGATWYAGLEEGILRGVTLQILPPIHLDDLFVRTHVAPDILHPQVTVTNATDHPVTVRLAARLSSANRARFAYPTLPTATATLPAKATQVIDLGKVAWTPGPSSYWWPNVPYRPGYQAQLHVLEVALQVNGQTVHRTRQRFGFRQFEARGAHYELNGVRCNLRGDNQQEADFGTDAYGIRPGFGPPSPDSPGWPQAVDNLLHLNFNVMRIHQIPATPYMLDVCDEKGLMLVDESPLRGSEGGEDFVAGRDNMLNMDRELVLRDRNHPAVVLWSAANEWAAPIREAIPVIQAVDDTRPIIADGIGDIGPNVINMQHYVNGLGGLPLTGGHPRTDRPYGETEAIWPMDNTWQGFAWMATTVRIRRLKGNADLRNYVLNNAWSNYVPGEGPETEILEKKVKKMGGDLEIRPAIADPWHHPLIRLMQQCYHPFAVCDVEFDRVNARSNAKGEWPTIRPRLAPGAHSVRQIAAFNDAFQGEEVTVRWQLRQGSQSGAQLAGGEVALRIPLGEFRIREIAFDAPKTEGEVTLRLASFKNGQEQFTEERIVFSVAAKSALLLPDGDYQLINRHSGLPAQVSAPSAPGGAPVVQGASGAPETQLWHLKNLGDADVILTNKATGQALTVGAAATDGTPAIQQPANGQNAQIWHLTDLEDGSYLLTNKATGKVLDVYGRATANGARIVQWERNDGDNQQWQLKRVGKE